MGDLTQSQFDNQKEVELRAPGENSQLFQDSILQQSHISGVGKQALFSEAGQSMMRGEGGAYKMRYEERPIVSINLEDVILHEDKLCHILEVSKNLC